MSTVNNLRNIIKVRKEVGDKVPAALAVTIERAIENLAYLCIQENLRQEADELLLELHYTHSLSDKVVRYKDSSIKNGPSANPEHFKATAACFPRRLSLLVGAQLPLPLF